MFDCLPVFSHPFGAEVRIFANQVLRDEQRRRTGTFRGERNAAGRRLKTKVNKQVGEGNGRIEMRDASRVKYYKDEGFL
jgi:hypothetical protein